MVNSCQVNIMRSKLPQSSFKCLSNAGIKFTLYREDSRLGSLHFTWHRTSTNKRWPVLVIYLFYGASYADKKLLTSKIKENSMISFELEPVDISALSDADLREMIGRLCEAELIMQGVQPSCVLWGGAQESIDGGLDVLVTESPTLNSPNFVPRQNTGFQVKKHSMGKGACTREMLEQGRVRPAISDLASKKRGIHNYQRQR